MFEEEHTQLYLTVLSKEDYHESITYRLCYRLIIENVRSETPEDNQPSVIVLPLPGAFHIHDLSRIFACKKLSIRNNIQSYLHSSSP